MKNPLLFPGICFFGLIILLNSIKPPAARAQGPTAVVPLAQHSAPSWPPRPDPVLVDPKIQQSQPLAFACPQPEGTINSGRYMRIVFMSYRDVKWEIYLRDGCYSPTIDRLTDNSAFDGYPRLDSAMSRIVFVSDRDGQDEIYAMDLAGKNLLRLTTDPAVDTYPAWSPDGQQIVFVSDRSGDPDLYWMNRDGSNVRLLVHLDGTDVEPHWSADGKQIAWVHWDSATTGKIYTLNTDGSAAPAPVTAELAGPGRPTWSPDGKYLAFEADTDGNGWRDLAWIDLTDNSFHWHTCAPANSAPCDFRMGGFWPEDGLVLGTQVTYTVNGSTLYIKNAELAQAWLTETGYGYALPLSRLDFAPDAVSTDVSAPVSRVEPLPAYSPASGFGIRVKATDKGSAGIYELTAAYSTSLDPTWRSWWDTWIDGDPAAVERSFYKPDGLNFTPGTMIYFRSAALDGAAHNEPTHPVPDTSTQVYSWGAVGQVSDQRGKPLEAVSAALTPAAMNQPRSDAAGAMGIYLQTDGSFGSIFTRPGYAGPPAQVFTSKMGYDLQFKSILPSGENLLPNGQFEDPAGVLNGWQTGGVITASAGVGHTGNRSVILGSPCLTAICFNPTESIPKDIFSLSRMAAASDGQIHVIYANFEGLKYTYRNLTGQWSSPLILNLTTPVFISDLCADPAGNMAFLFRTSEQLLQLAYKPYNLPWTFEQVPVDSWDLAVLRFDPVGRLHALISDGMHRMYYTRRETGGAWTAPLLVFEQDQGERFDLRPAPDGTVHIVYLITQSDTFGYVRILANGELSVPEVVDLGVGYPVTGRLPHLFLAPGGILHFVMDYYPFIYLTRSPIQGWSGLQLPYKTKVNHNYYLREAKMDDLGNLIMIIGEGYYPNSSDLDWMVKRAGKDQFELYHLDKELSFSEISLALSPSGIIHFLTDVGYWNGGATYRTLNIPTASVTGTLSQTVTIPADIHQPTLSFLYLLYQFLPAGQTGLQVSLQPQTGSPVSLLALHQLNDWQHAWADLSAWKGQTVTLTFQLSQAAGEDSARLSLDEVTLSAWTTLSVTSVEVSAPQPIVDWKTQPVQVRVLGENFAQSAKILLGGTEIVPTWISETELTFNLPANTPPGRHTLSVVNPGGVQASAPGVLELGRFFYLPTVKR